MSDKSKIEWTDATWNPVRGCEKVSPGCKNCYAIRTALRFSGPGQPYEGLVTADPPNWTGVLRFVPEKLAEPYGWSQPRMIFVNSMSDLFHDSLGDHQIAAVFGVMALCGHHTFQVLTKRMERAAHLLPLLTLDYCLAMLAETGAPFRLARQSRNVFKQMELLGRDPENEDWPPKHIFVGPSIENQAYADQRMPHAATVANAGWRVMVSCEPLLGPVNLGEDSATWCHYRGKVVAGECEHGLGCRERSFLDYVDWLIVGGESGDDARPMHPQWARDLRDQCAAAGVPFFYKQTGEWAPYSKALAEPLAYNDRLFDGTHFVKWTGDGWQPNLLDDSGEQVMIRVGKHAAGRLLDGREWSEFPIVGGVPV